jgi:fluoride exporter
MGATLVGVLTWAGVAFLGALGAVARFRVDSAVSARLPSDFPVGTLAVNLTGSFALGALVGISASHALALLLGVGFTGGYTTFSTWTVESERLGEVGQVVLLLGNLVLSMLMGLCVAAAGFYLVRAIA